MQTNTLRRATEIDLTEVVCRLRREDENEFAALGVDDLLPAMLRAFPLCGEVWAWDTEGGPIAILGVTPGDDPNIGHPWLIATPEMDHAGGARRPAWGRSCFDMIGSRYQTLFHLKWAGNRRHLAWLQRLGFRLGAEHTIPLTGQPFVEITR